MNDRTFQFIFRCNELPLCSDIVKGNGRDNTLSFAGFTKLYSKYIDERLTVVGGMGINISFHVPGDEAVQFSDFDDKFIINRPYEIMQSNKNRCGDTFKALWKWKTGEDNE